MTIASAKDLARCLDYALLKPDATRADVEHFCQEARKHLLRAVCVPGSHVELACSQLEETGVQVSALVGFPLGVADMDAKRYETEIAVDQGAHEIDFVINIGRLKDGDTRYVLREMRDVTEAADERPVKAILETHLLNRDDKLLACRLAVDSGVQFVSTSTDFNAPAASLHDVKLLREAVGLQFGIKVSGGIRDSKAALALIAAGANRIGTSAAAEVLRGFKD